MSDRQIPATIDPEGPGIPCPRCGCTHHRVVYTRQVANFTRRRRECRHCGRQFWTTERAPEATNGPDEPL